MNDLNDIIKYKNKKNNSLYTQYDPLLNTNVLIRRLDLEATDFMSDTPSWNKLLTGYKKKYILEYLNENNEIYVNDKKDILRNLYNSQLNKHYSIEYDCKSKKVIALSLIKTPHLK